MARRSEARRPGLSLAVTRYRTASPVIVRRATDSEVRSVRLQADPVSPAEVPPLAGPRPGYAWADRPEYEPPAVCSRPAAGSARREIGPRSFPYAPVASSP